MNCITVEITKHAEDILFGGKSEIKRQLSLSLVDKLEECFEYTELENDMYKVSISVYVPQPKHKGE